MKAQEWLDKNSPKKFRKDVDFLNIIDTIQGHLDLSDFPNLEILICVNKGINSIDLTNNTNLKSIELQGNRIKKDLNIFSHLTQLEKLVLGEKDKRGNDNDFYGSLQSLGNCQELKFLCIDDQKKINEGLNLLPRKKLHFFSCQGTVFEEILKPYDYNVEAWWNNKTRSPELFKKNLEQKKKQYPFSEKVSLINPVFHVGETVNVNETLEEETNYVNNDQKKAEEKVKKQPYFSIIKTDNKEVQTENEVEKINKEIQTEELNLSRFSFEFNKCLTYFGLGVIISLICVFFWKKWNNNSIKKNT